MYRRKKKLFALCLTITMLLTMVAFPKSVSASTTLGGADRYATALKIVQAGWTKSDNAIIARGDDLADALAAAPLAYSKGKAPILLTKPGELPTGVLNELKSLGVKNIYIVGGTGAVSTAVERALKDFKITRLTGKNRAETSYKVATEAFPVAPTEVVIANGLAYADALSISSIAAAKGMPILLVVNNKVSAEVAKYISGKTVYAVGGAGVLSQEVVNTAKATRLSGVDRYETNAAILDKFTQDYSKIYLAKGTNGNLVDALAGSALAAIGNNPIVLVNGKCEINAKSLAIVKANISVNSTEFLLGGTVLQSVGDAIRALKPSVLLVKSVSLNKTTDSITVGDTDTLTSTVNPLDATNKTVLWTSSNNNIATVDNAGKVTAISAGAATITVTTVDGSKIDNCIVIVNVNPDLADIASAKIAVSSLETATAKNLTVEVALTQAEDLIQQAKDALSKVDDVSEKVDDVSEKALLNIKVAAAEKTITNARTEFETVKTEKIAENLVVAYELAPVTTEAEVIAAEDLKPELAAINVVKNIDKKNAFLARIVVVDAKIADAKAAIATEKAAEVVAEAAVKAAETSRVDVDITAANIAVTAVKDTTKAAAFTSRINAINVLINITFPDMNLEQVIRDTIGKPTGNIYKSDVESIQYLEAIHENITNLSGIENLTNLTGLYLSKNPISNLEPLKGLTKLTELVLNSNEISNIEPLRGLTNLKFLQLYDNQIINIEPLNGMINLTELTLASNQIKDIEALRRLTNLYFLVICNNEISNIESLNGLTKLITLDLNNNKISNVEALDGLNKLTLLYLYNNTISNIESLNGMINMITLALNNNEISNIEPLRRLTKLEFLTLNSNLIKDYSPVSSYYRYLYTKDFMLVTSVILNKTTDTLLVGETDALLATINPQDATNKAVAWTSSNNNIATVDNTGKVTAISAGIAIITATTADGGKTSSCTMLINSVTPDTTPPQLKSISVDKPQVVGGDIVTITLGVTDDLSGVNSGWIDYDSPSGLVHRWANHLRLVDGKWQAEIITTEYDEIGKWKVVGVYLKDKAGNSVTINDDISLGDFEVK